MLSIAATALGIDDGKDDGGSGARGGDVDDDALPPLRLGEYREYAHATRHGSKSESSRKWHTTSTSARPP